MALHKKIGDVFVVNINNGYKRYFQFLGKDDTDLGGHVIRVFKKNYEINQEPALDDVVRGEIDFHAHVILQFGVKMGIWEKVGNVPYIQPRDVVFRTMHYMGHYPNLLKEDPQRYLQLSDAKQKISENWSIWRINEPFRFVGKLPQEYYHSESGGVYPPTDILYRIKNGRSEFIEPGYE